MNERERLCETLLFGKPDKIPLDPGEPRESTLEACHRQGLPRDGDWRRNWMRVLGIRCEPGQPRIYLGVSVGMLPRF